MNLTQSSPRFVKVKSAPNSSMEDLALNLDESALDTRRIKRRRHHKKLENVFRNLMFVGWFLSLTLFLQSYALI